MEVARKTTTENEDVQNKQELLNHVRQAFGTAVLCSEMNHLISDTGRVESTYNLVMVVFYYSGSKLRSLKCFSEAVRCGNTEVFLYWGIRYGEGLRLYPDDEGVF